MLVNGFDGSTVSTEDLRLLAYASQTASLSIPRHIFLSKKVKKKFEYRFDAGEWACRVWFEPPKRMPISAKIEVGVDLIRLSFGCFSHALISDCLQTKRIIEPYLVSRPNFVHWMGPIQEMRFQDDDDVVIGSAEWWVARDVNHEEADEDYGETSKDSAEEEAGENGWNFGNLQARPGEWVDFGD